MLQKVNKYMGQPEGKMRLEARWVRIPVKIPQKGPQEKVRAMVKMVSTKRGKSIEASIKRGKIIFSAAPMMQRNMGTTGTRLRERGGVSMTFI
jgi:hypothetical protein